MSEQEPEPCDFCGSNNVMLDEPITPDRYAVVCNKCGAIGPEDEDGNVAIAAWNTRPLEDALQARVDALEAVLDEIRLIARSVLPSEEVIADHQAHWNGKELYQIAKKAEAALNGEVKE